MEPATALLGPTNSADAPLSKWIQIALPVTTLSANER